MRHTKEEVAAAIRTARGIAAKAEAERRPMTNAERRIVDDAITKAEAFNTRQRVDQFGTRIAVEGDGDKRGWDALASRLVKGETAVEVKLGSVLGKAITAVPPDDEIADDRRAGITQLPADLRRAYQAFPQEDPGSALAVSEFKQTGSRTVTGSVERDLTATTAKAELDIALDIVESELRQMAILVSDVPNALFEAEPALNAFLASEMQLQLDIAMDQHVLAAIDAANPPFGSTGANIAEQLRHAIAAMQARGANPTVALIRSSDAVALDLMTSDSVPRGFPYGLRFVVLPDASLPEGAYLVDPRIAGVVYRGQLRLERNPYTGWAENTTSLRAEFSALAVIRNANGIFRIGGAEA